MIEIGQVDLKGAFRIEVREWDGIMLFPGYAVSIIPGVDNSVLLVRKSKLSICMTASFSVPG
jgi:hypothetical protein